MAFSRKGARMKQLYLILMLFTIAMIEMGRELMPLYFTRISSSLLETRPSKNKRRLLGKGIQSSEKAIGENKSRLRSNFLDQFMDIFSNNPQSIGTSAKNFAALVLKDNEIYCRKSQMKSLSRGRYFVQMLRQGLRKNPSRMMMTKRSGNYASATSAVGFPILIKHDDSNGCYPATHKDKYGFPRLTWSIPVNPTRTDHKLWCSAIGMPSYKEWRDLNHNIKGRKLDMGLKDAIYPWSAKLPKAVWRGSTTCNKGMYGNMPLEDIPRSILVKSSLDRPDLIDAGFHKFVGKYEHITMTESTGRMLKEAIPLEDMAKYKAIIDIDGNNWSARFHALLCTNSVIIKISPDFIEQYYHELEPNVHFIPASLDNLTQVVEYALDEGNDEKMKDIVKMANQWCHQSRNKDSFAKKAMGALDLYQDALEHYDGGNWKEEWESRSVLNKIDDMVVCDL